MVALLNFKRKNIHVNCRQNVGNADNNRYVHRVFYPPVLSDVRLRFGFFLIYASQGKFYIIYKGEMQILPIRTSPLGVIK